MHYIYIYYRFSKYYDSKLLFFSNITGQDTAAIESRLDEWLDRIHSNIIWGENNKLEDILKDIEKSVSSKNFILDSKVSVSYFEFNRLILNALFIIIPQLQSFPLINPCLFILDARSCRPNCLLFNQRRCQFTKAIKSYQKISDYLPKSFWPSTTK